MIRVKSRKPAHKHAESGNGYVFEQFPQLLCERAGYDGLYESIDTDALEEVLNEFERSHGSN